MLDLSYKFKHQIILNLLKERKADAIFFISGTNRFWITGLTTLDGFVFVTKNKTYLLVDYRDFGYCKKHINKNIDVLIYENIDSLKNLIKNLNIKVLLIEYEYLTLAQYDEFVKPLKVKSIPVPTMILRATKTEEEIKILQKSADIAVNAIANVRKWIKPGVTELETKQHIHQFMASQGASTDSFDLIIAFGKNTANPHHQSGNTILKNNELVTCDIGCIYQGYCSDITRTFFVGEKPSKEVLNMYELVKQAQALGLKEARVGIKGKDLDTKVRNFIATNKRWGELFIHGLGHGLGIEIHEFPACRQTYLDKINEGSVITIEPGVYEENFGGVRIEDSIVVFKDKIINLTKKASKNFFK